MSEYFRDQLKARLGRNLSVYDLGRNFNELGLESSDAIAIAEAMRRWTGTGFDPDVFWRHPSPRAVMAYLNRNVTDCHTVDAAGEPREPIAIIGLACRLPGGATQIEFWKTLSGGLCKIGPPSCTRFRSFQGAENVRQPRAGFLPDIEGFDALFFAISPREAAEMDPQQRLLLEVGWGAFEDAAIPQAELVGSRTAVFVGAMHSDFAAIAEGRARPYEASGADPSMLAARLSYHFGLEGPSMTVNTACSSSLVAVHLACRSLQAGDAGIAVAGGVNLLTTGRTFKAFEAMGMLSPTGQSRPFGAGANGYVRGEGAGLVVLKPLSQALRDRDRIYGTILGTAVNNDGASNGITAPNPAAQERVLRDAVHSAGIPESAIDYVEAHGTGTELGDPIEASALARTFGLAPDRATPLLIGSVKGNIGHLEGAAGIAGLLKVVLAMQEGQLPASLAADGKNPKIDFDAGKLQLCLERRSWPCGNAPPLAGVSSFGFGGTNAHAVLQGWRPATRPVEAGRRPSTSPKSDVGGITAYVYSGLGVDPRTSIWRFLGGCLEFAECFSDCDHAHQKQAGWSLFDEVYRTGTRSDIAVKLSQPLLVAFQISLTAVIAAAGLRPDLVVGHSIGEVSAAHAAGLINLEDAFHIVNAMSAVEAEFAGSGAMVYVTVSATEVQHCLSGIASTVEIAAVNGPNATVIAGSIADLKRVRAGLEAAGAEWMPIRTDLAHHTTILAPAEIELAERLAGLSVGKAECPMISTVTGAEIDDPVLDVAYWGRNMRCTVQFDAAIRSILHRGASRAVELGPHPILARDMAETAADARASLDVFFCARRDEQGFGHLNDALLRLGGTPRSGAAKDPDQKYPARRCSVFALPISAHTPEALTARIADIEDLCRREDTSLRALASRLARTTTPHGHRAALVVKDAGGGSPVAVEKIDSGLSNCTSASVIFAYCGQTVQVGMGLNLWRNQPVAREIFEQCASRIRDQAGWSLKQELSRCEHETRLDRTEHLQPALFCVQAALTTLLRHWGLRPSAVIGHSVGEIAAAFCADVLPLETALDLVLARGSAITPLRGQGKMLAVGLSEEEARTAITAHGKALAIAAVNAPRLCVLSGAPRTIRTLAAELTGRGVFSSLLPMDYAFHNPQMSAAAESFREAIGEIPSQDPSTPWFSTVTGALVPPGPLDPQHWYRGIVAPVRFAQAMSAALASQESALVIEIGPGPVLAASIRQIARDIGAGAEVLPCQEPEDNLGALARVVAKVHASGGDPAWEAIFHERHAGVALPPYPFQRTRYPVVRNALAKNETATSAHARPLKNPGPAPAEADEMLRYYRTLTQANDAGVYLRFGALSQALPEFSWLRAWIDPDVFPEDRRIMQQAVDRMWAVLFDGLDLSHAERVMDIGCGYGTDLLRIAEAEPHLALTGVNISSEQIKITSERIRAAGLKKRVTLLEANVMTDDLTPDNDLVITFQVVHHLTDKPAAIANIARHMRPGGVWIAAEILSALASPIDAPTSSAHFSPRSQWADDLSEAGLRVVRCIDASAEVARYLYSQSFETDLATFSHRFDSVAIAHLRGPHELEELLEREIALYLLMTVQRETLMSSEALLQFNRAALDAPQPFPDRSGATAAPAVAPQQIYHPSSGAEPTDALIRRHAARLLGQPAESLDLVVPLGRYGIDSLMTLELRRAIERDTGAVLPVSFFFNYPSIGKAAAALEEMLKRSSPIADAPTVSPDGARAKLERPLEEAERVPHGE